MAKRRSLNRTLAKTLKELSKATSLFDPSSHEAKELKAIVTEGKKLIKGDKHGKN